MNIESALGDGAAPIVAILRGIHPLETADIARALIDAQIRIIEVPLNSPEPLESIARLRSSFDDVAAIGAGTVLDCDSLAAAANAGARFIVAPNTDPAVIHSAIARGLDPMPGFFTATEAFAALRAGARRLKLFPASSSAPEHVRSLRDVLPAGTEIWAVGGAGAANIARWIESGAAGLGVGAGLFRSGDAASTVGRRARDLVAAWNAAKK
jgi:2-dehydro-3-deoxyphosphogalactonate aldolase